MGFCDHGRPPGYHGPVESFSIPCESWGSATPAGNRSRPNHNTLSVFPANRGVLRPKPVSPPHSPRTSPFSIPCESWGSATLLSRLLREYSTIAFSIPCESWGSATYYLDPTEAQNLSFSIPCESWGSATMGRAFGSIMWAGTFSIPCESWGSATSLRRRCRRGRSRDSLSVFPANRGVLRLPEYLPISWVNFFFQYSLRIVGFCDITTRIQSNRTISLSVFPANRGVLRQAPGTNGRGTRSRLSVFPANRGVLRQIYTKIQRPLPWTFSIPCESWGSATPLGPPIDALVRCPFSIPCESWGSATEYVRPFLPSFQIAFSIPCESWGSATSESPSGMVTHFAFQYSLRIVGFCDFTWPRSWKPFRALSVFPANRGVLRLGLRLHTSVCYNSFSIPCESWGSATVVITVRISYSSPFFQYSLRIVGFCDSS